MPATPPPPSPRQPWGLAVIWRWLRRYFGFSRAATRGFVLLLLVLLGVAVVPPLLRPADPVYLPAADQQQLDTWAKDLSARLAQSDSAERQRYAGRRNFGAERAARYPQVAQVKLAPFDPNALTANGWEARGVPHFVAGRLVNYGQKAGGFKAKAQVQRVYGLSDSVYQRLAPFMQLPDELPGRKDYARGGATFPANSLNRFPRKSSRLLPFDLNKADTTQLQQIRGIGRGRAKWIVQRRTDLGGYLDEAQLADVFVLRDAPDLVDSLRKYTFVAPGFVPQTLNINTATFDELWPQPYVGKSLARLIVAFRKQHGPYKTPEDLRQIKILKEESFAKLRPYVRCE
ncbi:MAG: ComEA family DNA-binding protein [Janthinobacterium lividum]